MQLLANDTDSLTPYSEGCLHLRFGCLLPAFPLLFELQPWHTRLLVPHRVARRASTGLNQEMDGALVLLPLPVVDSQIEGVLAATLVLADLMMAWNPPGLRSPS